MFYNCDKLTILNISNFKGTKVNKMDNMFYNCIQLQSLDLSNFGNSSSSINMEYLFCNCFSLTSINISKQVPITINNMNSMFYNC